MNKNHIGFVADDSLNLIPDAWPNIVCGSNGISQLNYAKMNANIVGGAQGTAK